MQNNQINHNPIRRVRVKEGKTLVELAADCGVHLQALYLNECGVYPTILPSILTCLIRLGYSGSVLEKDYQMFVHNKRVSSGVFFELSSYTLPPPVGTQHPFISFRKSLELSRMGFCKSFCVHPASMHKVEHEQVQCLPRQVIEALNEAGLSEQTTEELDYRVREWAEGAWLEAS